MNGSWSASMAHSIPQKRRRLGKILWHYLKLIMVHGCVLGTSILCWMRMKFLGGKKGSTSTNYLKDLMFEVGAIDLGYSECKYTRAKDKWGNAAIKRRLDWGIANISWRLAYSKAMLAHLGAIGSEHTPITLDTNPQTSFAHRPFRFEVAWLRDERCASVIDSAWNIETSGSEFIKLCKKQAATKDALRKWTQGSFRKVPGQDQCLYQAHQRNSKSVSIESIWGIRRSPSSGACRMAALEWNTVAPKIKGVVAEVRGKKNSKFFHLSTIVRRKRNSINAIWEGNGAWITEGNAIRKRFLEHFKDLFQ